MLDYRIPVKRRSARYKPTLTDITQETAGEEPLGLIYGRTPNSKEEWWIALALWRLGHNFEYQVPIFGGYWIRGGQILDFVVRSTVPLDTIIQFNGDYWHGGVTDSQESFNATRVQKEFEDTARVIVMWSDDAPNKEVVYSFLRRRLL